ncbi:hypothetical protein TW95_gp1326 [Pandoravirus inopinatum]|uniref:Uncharacterized protein n=1 Tax=Pandoravirus inopinatum TaxID=1605721 RepID=A0A0B5J811_9VIRU|nr:hypothetical protein TW95_gp1326 [Pandoravirus inopinatum]AJF98060.1 hypothetical protein [Pandoravirus inopinatum]
MDNGSDLSAAPALSVERQPKPDPAVDRAKETCPRTDLDPHPNQDNGQGQDQDTDQDQHRQGASDLLALRRRAIAFPDPVVVGAPPEGVTETVLTWRRCATRWRRLRRPRSQRRPSRHAAGASAKRRPRSAPSIQARRRRVPRPRKNRARASGAATRPPRRRRRCRRW